MPPVHRRDRRAAGTAGRLHHPGRTRHARPYPDRAADPAAARGDGALPFRPSPRLPPVPGQRQLRAAGDGRCVGLASGALWPGRGQPSGGRARPLQSLFPVRSRPLHRLYPLCPGVRAGSGQLRPDRARARLCLAHCHRRRRFPQLRMRLVRRLRSGVPDRGVDRAQRDRAGPARSGGPDHLCLLWRRLHPQGRVAGRPAGADGSSQERPGQCRPCLHQGPLCLGLRQPPRPHHHAHGARSHRSAVAQRQLGGGDRPGGRGLPGEPAPLRPRGGGRGDLVALHQRGSVPGAEAGAGGVRHQQRRYPAPASATRPPAMASRPPSAPRPEPRTSPRSTTPT